MTEKANSPEGVLRPSLDDPLVIKDLLLAHAMATSRRLAEASHKNVRKEEVIEADKRAAAFLASTLYGNNPAYEPARKNTKEQIEKNLRGSIADLLKLYEIDSKELKDPLPLFQVAMFAYTNQIHELINELQKNPETIEAVGQQKLQALIADWLEKIIGKQ